MCVDVEGLYYLLNTKSQLVEKENAKEFEFKKGEIEFKNLYFSHFFIEEDSDIEDGKDQDEAELKVRERVILNDFNLRIEPGTTNAIVGPSGFGKTTLFNLLMRILDPGSG